MTNIKKLISNLTKDRISYNSVSSKTSAKMVLTPLSKCSRPAFRLWATLKCQVSPARLAAAVTDSCLTKQASNQHPLLKGHSSRSSDLNLLTNVNLISQVLAQRSTQAWDNYCNKTCNRTKIIQSSSSRQERCQATALPEMSRASTRPNREALRQTSASWPNSSQAGCPITKLRAATNQIQQFKTIT